MLSLRDTSPLLFLSQKNIGSCFRTSESLLTGKVYLLNTVRTVNVHFVTMRAKFRCDGVTAGDGYEEVFLWAVWGGSTNAEDNQFSAATPSGELKMTISNPNAFGFFKPEGKYYLDITVAE